MKRFLMAATLTLAAWIAPAHALVIDQDIFNGHTYVLLDSGQTWLQQKAEAVSLGGHLVTINDASENTFIWDRFGVPGTGLFMGFYDPLNDNNWGWVSGEAVSYVNWRPGEPNNVGGNEDFGELGDDYQWNDVGPLHTWAAVVELNFVQVPEPATLALLGLGFASLGFSRRRTH